MAETPPSLFVLFLQCFEIFDVSKCLKRKSRSVSSQGRRAEKKTKLVGRDWVGSAPKEFSDNDIVKMEYHIHNFADREEKRGEHLYTGVINAHGHPWKLLIYPRGCNESSTDTEYVSIYMHYAGSNTKTDPVLAKATIWTKTAHRQIKKHEYIKEDRGLGRHNFFKREDIIQKNCNDAGTLMITVELQVANRSIWFPRLTHCDNIGTELYRSTETSDVTFIVGTSTSTSNSMQKEFMVHKCILALRARDLYELVITEEESSSSGITTGIILNDVDESSFGVMMEFIYTGTVPSFDTPSSSGDDRYNEYCDTVTSILTTANRFGVMELKLHIESILIEKFLTPSNAAGLLLLADSHSCGLLKEASMNAYMADSEASMNNMDSSDNNNWKMLQKSTKLLTELLVYTNSGRRRYSSMVDDGDGTLDDVDNFDVTSLRERLQMYDLDVDGSREILVERWKNYLRSSSTTNTDTAGRSLSPRSF
jgi:hypothetical protein